MNDNELEAVRNAITMIENIQSDMAAMNERQKKRARKKLESLRKELERLKQAELFPEGDQGRTDGEK